MSSNKLMTKEQYLQAQDQLLDEAMEGDLCKSRFIQRRTESYG